jgi:hypothetical protein
MGFPISKRCKNEPNCGTGDRGTRVPVPCPAVTRIEKLRNEPNGGIRDDRECSDGRWRPRTAIRRRMAVAPRRKLRNGPNCGTRDRGTGNGLESRVLGPLPPRHAEEKLRNGPNGGMSKKGKWDGWKDPENDGRCRNRKHLRTNLGKDRWWDAAGPGMC